MKVYSTRTGKRLKISLYDTELYKQTGSGSRTIVIPFDGRTEEEMMEIGRRMKEDQSSKNKEWYLSARDRHTAESVVNGEAPPPTPINVLARPGHKEIVRPNHSPYLSLDLDKGTGNSIAILGSSKRGKSTLLAWIYRTYYAPDGPETKYDYISTLFTVNPQAPVYKGLKKLIVCGGWTEKGEKLIKLEKLINTRGAKKNKYHFLTILDDVVDAKASKLLANLILTWRNSNMSSIISLQDPMLLSKTARSNVNCILLFGFNSDERVEDVVKMYLRGYFAKRIHEGEEGLKSLGAQIQWYKDATADHGFIYMHPVDGKISLHRLGK